MVKRVDLGHLKSSVILNMNKESLQLQLIMVFKNGQFQRLAHIRSKSGGPRVVRGRAMITII